MSGFAITLSAALSMAVQTGPCEGVEAPPGATVTSIERVAADGTLPEHCRVAAVLAPSDDSEIGMEV